MIVTTSDISHSGVKGMKHYQHKFGKWQKQAQYAGGRDDPDKKTSINKLKSYSSERKLSRREKKMAALEAKEKEKERIRNLTREELLKSSDPKEILARKDLLSTQELIERKNRLQAEADIERFIKNPEPKQEQRYFNGKKMIADALQRSGATVLTEIGTGLGRYLYSTALTKLAPPDARATIIKMTPNIIAENAKAEAEAKKKKAG